MTNAKGDRRLERPDLRFRMTSSLTSTGTLYSEWLKYEGMVNAANFNQGLVRDGTALAEQTLVAMQADAQDARSQGPTGQPATESPR